MCTSSCHGYSKQVEGIVQCAAVDWMSLVVRFSSEASTKQPSNINLKESSHGWACLQWLLVQCTTAVIYAGILASHQGGLDACQVEAVQTTAGQIPHNKCIAGFVCGQLWSLYLGSRVINRMIYPEHHGKTGLLMMHSIQLKQLSWCLIIRECMHTSRAMSTKQNKKLWHFWMKCILQHLYLLSNFVCDSSCSHITSLLDVEWQAEAAVLKPRPMYTPWKQGISDRIMTMLYQPLDTGCWNIIMNRDATKKTKHHICRLIMTM